MKPHASTRKKIVLSGIILAGLLATTIYFTPTPIYNEGFKTLKELQAHAASLDEYIAMDTENSIKPDFTSYYKTLAPTWKTRIKDKILWWPRRFGLYPPPAWSATFFKHQLLTLATTRQARHYTNSAVCKITTTPETRFFVIGTLQGAFHSLVRDLTNLNERGVINDKLIVTDPNTYLIFMGDVVSRSPFGMETLSTVMQLLARNPLNVIYLRGGHESNNYWQEHTLKLELQMRASDLDKNPVPLVDDVNRFFNTLPLALYLTIPQQPNTYIRLSLPGRTANELLLEPGFATQLIADTGTPLTHFDVSKRGSNDEGIAITIPIIIRGEKKRETFQPHKGLRLLPPDNGSIAWTILSCPTPVYQRAVKFYYDTFVELCPAPRLEGWTIILNHHDVRTKDPFKTTTFSLFTGKELGADEQKKLGVPTPTQTSKKQPAQARKPVPNESEADLITTLTAEAHELSEEAKVLEKTADKLLKRLPQQPPSAAHVEPQGATVEPAASQPPATTDQPTKALAQPTTTQPKPSTQPQTKAQTMPPKTSPKKANTEQEQPPSSAFEPIEQAPDEQPSGTKPLSNNP
jgi:hypothetical protein